MRPARYRHEYYRRRSFSPNHRSCVLANAPPPNQPRYLLLIDSKMTGGTESVVMSLLLMVANVCLIVVIFR